MTARVTQIGIQGLVKGDPDARLAQIGVQSLVKNIPDVRVSQLGIKALARNNKNADEIEPTTRLLQATTSASLGIPGDPYYNKVSLLLQADKGFRDLSKYNDYVNGDRGFLFIRDTPAKFLKAFESVSSNTMGIRYDRNPERFDFGRGAFTIEGWINRPAFSGFRYIMGNWYLKTERSWFIGTNNNALTFRASIDGTEANFFNLEGADLPANTWTHICVERDIEGTVRMYVNGQTVATGTFPNEIRKVDTKLILMGRNHSSSIGGMNNFEGLLDDFRVTKGVARYASDAGFVIPTAPNPIGPVDYEPFNTDPFWDKTTCVLDPFDGAAIDYKRGATITGLTASSLQFSGVGTIAHVDGQWNFGGRTEPFTFEVDIGWNSSSGNSVVQIICPGNWHLATGTSVIAFRVWNGTSFVEVFSWPNIDADWYFPRATETTIITRDEMGVYRFYQQGKYMGSAVAPFAPDTPTADLTINADSARVIRCLRMTWDAVRYREEDFINSPIADLPPPRSGPAYAAPILPDATYPYDLAFPDPKDGAVTWRSVVGASPSPRTIHTSGVLYEEDPNDRWRWATGNSSTTLLDYHRLLIPVQYLDDIDAGGVFLEYSALAAAPFDHAGNGTLVALALDKNSQMLNASSSDAVVTDKTFKNTQGAMFLPVGTRTVEVGILAGLSAFQGNYVMSRISARLVDGFEDAREYLSKPTQLMGSIIKTDNTEWTDARGGTIIDTANLSWLATSLTTTQRVMDLRCVDDLPSSFFTSIDNGLAAFRFKAIATQNEVDDFGWAYVEFLDVSDQVVGRRVFSSPNPRVASPRFVGLNVDCPIPVGARKVVMAIMGSMNYGEVVNGTNQINFPTNFHEAYCYIPASGEMPVIPVPPTPAGDEHWDNVVCLLSTRNGVIENLGNPRYREHIAPVGVSVASIDSPFGDTAIASNLSLVTGNSFYVEVKLADFEGGAFGPQMTFEGWFYRTHPVNTALPSIGIHNQLNGNNGAIDGATTGILMDGVTTTNVQSIIDQWYHIAYCRDETGRAVLFVNGERQNIGRTAFATLWNRVFRIGQWNVASNVFGWCGYYDEIRITKDVERYTENFTPPGNRYPTKLPSGSLLLNGETGRLLLSGDTGGILT